MKISREVNPCNAKRNFLPNRCFNLSDHCKRNNENNILQDYCIPFLVQNCFRPVLCPEQYSPVGRCWEIVLALGEGGYWVYAEQNLFDIKIHGFYFHEDFCLEMDIPECISLQR